MRPYQEEYIANIRTISALTKRKKHGELTADAYEASLRQNEAAARQLVRRNMELLRTQLFPTLDNIFEANCQTLQELDEFASHLAGGSETQDEGLFRMIHRALLILARRREDRCGIIKELYWLGMGYFWLYSKLVGLELDHVEKYVSQMRLCFTEAAAYLKYYDDIEDTETRGYILRSRANMSLGLFKTPGEKIAMARETLHIMQDESYHASTPDLPWDRYVYTTHQQMASSISYNKRNPMEPQDMTSVIESAYIVYQRRLQEAEAQNQIPPLRWAFPYYAMEYYCGFYDLDHLLSKVEKLLSLPELSDQTPDGMYGILSLPAFYSQYLQQYPERIPGRASYLAFLYRRALAYADSFPTADSDKLFLYFRQLTFTYIETDEGIPFGTFLQEVLLRFAPEIYVHSWTVGTAAKILCGIILDEEPDFFDDMEDIRQIPDPAEKRRRILDDAMQSGLLHDAGKINFLEFYSRTVRQWFAEEFEVTRLHSYAGSVLLDERESTKRFAPAALGHHSWYDGTDHGGAIEYKRLECSCRQMVDVIALVDWLECTSHTAQAYEGIDMTFDEAIAEAIAMEGHQFSPLLTARLRDAKVVEQIRDAFEDGRREAYWQMYEKEHSLGEAAKVVSA